MSSNVSYSYNASAIGLGGVIRKGKRTTVVPTVASVCLASAGGEASNSVENYYRDGISFSRAESRVAGYSVTRGGSRHHYTYADVFISNLQIFDRLKIALMQATVTSTREIDSDEPSLELFPDRTRFSLRVIYRGIEIDGEEIAPDVDWDLCHAEKYDNFMRLLKGRPHVPARIARLLGTVQTDPTKLIVDRDRPPLSGPLVNFQGNGNKLKLPKFGKAKFADVVVKPDRQRVSLLRLTLDSDWLTAHPDDEPEKFSFVPPPAPEPQPQPEPEEQTTTEPETRTFSLSANSDGGDGGDGEGGSMSGGDGGSNGVPIWT